MKPKVLVVCHGNVNRSAAAELALRYFEPLLDVRSAGFRDDPGLRMAKKSRTWWAQRQLDEATTRWAEDHRSQTITPGLVDWADYVLLFDRSNVRKFEAFTPYLRPGAEVALYLPRGQYLQDPGFLKADDPRYERIMRSIWDATPGLARALRLAYTSRTSLSEVRSGRE